MKAAHDYEALHGCLMMHTLDRSRLQYQAWSTPDQTIWSQYFSHALPRRVNSNVLAVGPYGESNAEESERIAPAKTPSRPCPYSQYALICLRWNKEGCRSPDCMYRHVCFHAMDHIESHTAQQKKKVYRSTGRHFGGRVAPVLVANNSNELSQEQHTHHTLHQGMHHMTQQETHRMFHHQHYKM